MIPSEEPITPTSMAVKLTTPKPDGIFGENRRQR